MMQKASFSWRRFAALTLSTALIVPMIAACGGSSPATTTDTNTTTNANANAATGGGPAAAATAPAAGGETNTNTGGSAASTGRGAGGMLRLLWWQAPTILNFHLGQGTKDLDASRLMLEPLISFNPDGEPFPVLAAEVPTVENGGVSEDLTTVTWKLKEGVKWSDGSDFTSEDVVFTYNYCADEATACTTSAAFAGVASVEAVDPLTVKVTWTEPNPNPYQMFASTTGEILQKAQFGNCIGEKASTDTACQQANNAPIGTGPYKLREFRPGDSVAYDINENYREADKPFFKEVSIKGGGDATSAARAVFQTGDVDYAWNLQVEGAVLNQLQQGGLADLVTVGGSSVERLVINFANPDPALGENRAEPDQPHPFLTDLNVRKALMMSIDRQAIAGLYSPGNNPTCEIITTEPFFSPDELYNGHNQCGPDVEGAKALLDQAGWVPGADGIREKDGVKLSVLYQTTVNPLRQKEQALVKQAWQQIGVQAELKTVDPAVFFSSDAGNPDTFGHFFADIQMYTNNYSDPDPTNYLCDFTTEQIASRANGWRLGNNGRYSNPEYDQLCQQLRTEKDQTKRQDIVRQMNDILVTDVAVIPLVARATVSSGKAKNLQGVNPTPWDSELYNVADWTMSQ